MASVAESSSGVAGFLSSALRPLFARPVFILILLLGVLLTASNIVILHNAPVKGQMPPVAFIAAAFVRVAGLLVMSVAILRRINASPRPAWSPDTGFWLFVLTFAVEAAATGALTMAAGGPEAQLAGLLVNVGATFVFAPLAAWFIALAVERPLAWRPAPWLRGWSLWLAPYLIWMVLLAIPLGAMHQAIDTRLVKGAGEGFWPLALIDGPLSLILCIVGLALASEAYRRVARG
ncbi:MAG: hypothetical protein ABIW83_04140 [Allosphingosinicella sp.]